MDTGCLPPADYLLSVQPVLTEIECSKVYDLSFPNKCGQVSMSAGEGEFVAPTEWVSPKCGTEGELCFVDENGSYGFTTFKFSPEHWCIPLAWPSFNPVDIDPDISKPIYVEHGVAPYHWEVTGTGFTLANSDTPDPVNSLYASPSSCGTAKVMVSDICGNVCTGHVMSTAGTWVLQGDYCGLSGVGIEIGSSPPTDTYFELISGHQRQLQTRYWVGATGSEPNCSSPPPIIYCTANILYYCGETRIPNCIDPVNVYPYYCFDPPGNGWDCYCVAGLHYYEWGCA